MTTKTIGFSSFASWSQQRSSAVRTAADSVRQSVELAVAAEEIGIDGASFRVHHFADQQTSVLPLLAYIAASTTTLEVGTSVIDMRYEQPLHLAEEAASTDLLSGGRLQLGVSRGSPEHADRGYRWFGAVPAPGTTDADLARERTTALLDALDGTPIADADPRYGPAASKIAITPRSPSLRQRVWWGAGSRATAVWAAQQGMQLMSSTLVQNEAALPFDELQLGQLEAFRAAWSEAGWDWAPRTSVSRSILPIVDDATRAAFAGQRSGGEGVGLLEGIDTRFGRSFVGEVDHLVEQLGQDVALAAADMVLVTVPSQLGVDLNIRLLEGVRAIGDELGWGRRAGS